MKASSRKMPVYTGGEGEGAGVRVCLRVARGVDVGVLVGGGSVGTTVWVAEPVCVGVGIGVVAWAIAATPGVGVGHGPRTGADSMTRIRMTNPASITPPATQTHGGKAARFVGWAAGAAGWGAGVGVRGAVEG